MEEKEDFVSVDPNEVSIDDDKAILWALLEEIERLKVNGFTDAANAIPSDRDVPETTASNYATGTNEDLSPSTLINEGLSRILKRIASKSANEDVHLTSAELENAAKLNSSDKKTLEETPILNGEGTGLNMYLISSPEAKTPTKEFSDEKVSQAFAKNDSTETDKRINVISLSEAKGTTRATSSDAGASKTSTQHETTENDEKVNFISSAEATGTTEVISSDAELSKKSTQKGATGTSEKISLIAHLGAKGTTKAIFSDAEMAKRSAENDTIGTGESIHFTTSTEAKKETEAIYLDETTGESEKREDPILPRNQHVNPYFVLTCADLHIFLLEWPLTELASCFPEREIEVVFSEECDTKATVILRKEIEDGEECIKLQMTVTTPIENELQGIFEVQTFNASENSIDTWRSVKSFNQENPSGNCLDIKYSELFARNRTGRLVRGQDQTEELQIRIRITITGCCDYDSSIFDKYSKTQPPSDTDRRKCSAERKYTFTYDVSNC